MSRSCFSFKYTSFEKTKRIIESELKSNGYSQKIENGENLWKSGIGLLTAMKYIKVEFSGNEEVKIYGWIRPMASPEQKLEGIVAALPKKQVLKLIQRIGNLIAQC